MTRKGGEVPGGNNFCSLLPIINVKQAVGLDYLETSVDGGVSDGIANFLREFLAVHQLHEKCFDGCRW